MTTDKVKLAVLGAGLIGRKHCRLITSDTQAELAVIIDPSASAEQFAAECGADWFSSLEHMISTCSHLSDKIDGAIIATPNDCHAPQAVMLMGHGIPVLIEKPLAESAEAAMHIKQASLTYDVPVLVGHHRRHNPLISQAKKMIEDGAIGRPLAATVMCWLMKPDNYFETEWRQRKGAGPVYINLSHDLDLVRYLLGEVVSVYAQERHEARGFEVEDTASIMLSLTGGAVATINLSDTIVAPWSWEHTAGENPAYPRTTEHAYLIGGTHGSLGLPNLSLWRAESERSWWQPLTQMKPIYGNDDPFSCQLSHFLDVISKKCSPLVTADDGIANVATIDAIKESAHTGQPIKL